MIIPYLIIILTTVPKIKNSPKKVIYNNTMAVRKKMQIEQKELGLTIIPYLIKYVTQ